jgi:hypothetical protein
MKNIRIIFAFALLVGIYSCVGNESAIPSLADGKLYGVVKGVRKFQTVSDYEFAIHKKTFKTSMDLFQWEKLSEINPSTEQHLAE